MPDPRKPQRTPQPRQGAPEPFRGPAQERPVPSNPDADKVPGIHVGDPNAAGNLARARPVRMLEPSQQAPLVEYERKLRKGESYWVVGSRDVPRPRKARIVRISNEPGKLVGVEFDEPIGGRDDEGQPWGVVHTCDGRGKAGHCLYVRPDMVLDDQAMDAHKARQSQFEAESGFEDFDELTVNPSSSQPMTPMPPHNGHANGGPLKLEELAEGKEEEEEPEDH